MDIINKLKWVQEVKKLILICLLFACSVQAATYYLNNQSTGGNGTTSALTGPNAAFNTISAAQAVKEKMKKLIWTDGT